MVDFSPSGRSISIKRRSDHQGVLQTSRKAGCFSLQWANVRWLAGRTRERWVLESSRGRKGVFEGGWVPKGVFEGGWGAKGVFEGCWGAKGVFEGGWGHKGMFEGG